ncbi:uncharacterized protein LOC125239536 [Leguminivora glycinivorella]|uniref:uncharacterized protein LOC125239536 n=1 Tax=Leguminivora glycinivorella TaxID=1035111 RepID=UPI00200D24E7|nr:uncharacterized protein LOC125239536 [Leguminivora glycinivorella]
METSAESGSMSPARVKLEPETDQSEMSIVKEEAVFLDEEERVKEEWSDSTAGRGVSEAAMLADLYIEHEVKDELVLGPERPHRPVVAPAALYNRVAASALVSPAAVSGVRRSCSVRLERLLVDAARRTCRVARRTYKLRAAEPAHTPSAIATEYQCHHCGKRFRNNLDALCVRGLSGGIRSACRGASTSTTSAAAASPENLHS